MNIFKTKLSLSIIALIGVNLIPLVGVILLGWDAAMIILLYWTENVVVGTFNVLKMATVKGDSPSGHFGKLFAIPFFCVHFGGFCAVHGIFLLFFLKIGDMNAVFPSGDVWLGPFVFIQLFINVVRMLWDHHPSGMGWVVLALFVSHGISFVQNFIYKKEYYDLKIGQVMGLPYKRIALLHLTIIAGGVPIMMLGSPVPLLCILILLKIVMDVSMHLKERKISAAAIALSQ